MTTQTLEFKSDLARFARAHENTGITWRAIAGEGGTIIILDTADEEA
jgi:hypothetical protein